MATTVHENNTRALPIAITVDHSLILPNGHFSIPSHSELCKVVLSPVAKDAHLLNVNVLSFAQQTAVEQNSGGEVGRQETDYYYSRLTRDQRTGKLRTLVMLWDVHHLECSRRLDLISSSLRNLREQNATSRPSRSQRPRRGDPSLRLRRRQMTTLQPSPTRSTSSDKLPISLPTCLDGMTAETRGHRHKSQSNITRSPACQLFGATILFDKDFWHQERRPALHRLWLATLAIELSRK
ncbi:hypothetical protein RSOLAG1IB_11140 [Rhizoctonia solani AG-1 IB]|uniref:Uncharacterized protein n=1 Tax=Thanatephorus cucumeris (strain AG1-IB / isolate 7/3/14) TaxID=1108050 RepID=A0A0B7F5H9_THACB|nr:hypothetical protein RSOLAG1IB_11140 [Rhizoctonia solani AG-1 IB]